MPTENGTVLHAGRRPTRDAAVVERLRAAGAVILGKTVTTELAVYHPGKTRNPHDPGTHAGRLLVGLGGGGGGGHGAARDRLADQRLGDPPGELLRRVRLQALARPDLALWRARPSRRRSTTSACSRARVEDLALIAEPLIGFDARDRDTRLEAPPRLLEVARQDWPLAPDLALVKSPVWDQAEDDLKAAFAELAEALGPRITEVDLPEAFKAAHGLHGLIMGVDLARSFAGEYARGRDQLSERLRGIIEDGRRALAIDYARALELVPALRDSLDPLFARYDMIVTPATTGQAPRGLSSTGSPTFCTIWTLLGLPAVTLPLLTGADGMPIGVQLVGRFGDDARLLRTARWLVSTIAGLDAGRAA